MSNLSEPFYADTQFPILKEISGNKPGTEEAFLEYLGDLMGVEDDQREEFQQTVRNGEYLPDESWVLKLQEDFTRMVEETEDAHQDAIDQIEADFGADVQNSDIRGFYPLLQPHPNPELFALEKEYMMTPEEVQEWDRIAEMQQQFRNEEAEKIPSLVDPFE